MKYLFIAIRPYQWTKNLFIFLPLIFGGQLLDVSVLIKTTITFFLFSFAASAMYLINDVVDLESDKKHPIKRLRPLASGKITIIQAEISALILITFAILFSFLLDKNICWVVIAYIALNYIYTKILKNAVIIDVFCVGAFFYLRILAGSLSSNVILSNWIILCTALLALFIAFNKRRYDLRVARESKTVYRKYNIYFIDRMISIISASMIMAYALYTMDQQTVERFGTQHMIYTVPFVYYGIFRYLYLVDKKGYGGDPTFVLLKDRKTQLNLLLWILASIGIIYFKR